MIHLDRPIIASVLGNGTAVLAVVASAVDLIHRWGAIASIAVVIGLNASLIVIAWRKERRDARREARAEAAAARECDRQQCDDRLPSRRPTLYENGGDI